MISIIICDDDAGFAARLKDLLHQTLQTENRRARIHIFDAMETISAYMLSGCDLAFLDIDFDRKRYTGIDIARKLRQYRKDAVIIFITNYLEYAPEGYEVGAFRYVLKSEVEKKLPLYLPEALAQLETQQEVLKIQNYGERIDIPLPQILYLESQQHTVTIHTTQRDHIFYSSLTALEKQLESKGFLRIHKSYLVNMAHLTRYQSHEAVLTDGTVLRVSARSYGEKKQQYLLWKGRPR